ncbi:MAG: hypothetical protein CW716_04820 [Candidatus Bathyarchaeum sp.]|nr:MAG: hypothetical protein CW716_04820 [Candidatus Bathyarchaeum sp.]
MMKFVSRVFLMLILFSSLELIAAVHVFAEAPGVIVVIGSDAVWAKADSPYVLTGPVFVANDATLTIEAGVEVDLDGYYITVNGTLLVLGTSSERIQMTNGEKIEFTEFSTGWNKETGLGGIISHANVTCPIFSSVSLKLDTCILATLDVEDSVLVSNSEIGGRVTVGNSSEIYDNILGDRVLVGGSSVICNNNINGSIKGECVTVSNNTVMGHVGVDYSTVSNNMIIGGISGESLTITGNVATAQENPDGVFAIGGAAIRISGGTSVISGNTLDGGGYRFDWGGRGSGTIGTIDVGSCSAVISDNVIDGEGIYLTGDCDSLVIANNTIDSGIFCKLITWEGTRAVFDVNSFEITGNVITGTIEVKASYLSVSNNLLVGSIGTGLEFSVHGETISSISDNTISGFFTGISGTTTKGVLIKKNLIINNTRGIECTALNMRVQNNTITNNTIGIYEGSPSAIIRYNNIENNTENSIYLETTTENIDARYNWWGTADHQAVNLTIRDHKYDFDVGTVTFTPFLTEPNPEAVPNEIPEFSAWLVLLLFLVATLVGSVYRKRMKKQEIV